MKNQTQLAYGFGQGVHEYLYQHVIIADAKASGLILLNGTIGTLLIQNQPPIGLSYVLTWIALIFFAISIAFDVLTLFPRLPGGGKGIIFWEDVLTRKNPEDYASDVIEKITSLEVERDYAIQNWYVSKVVHKKYIQVRQSILWLLLGSIFSILSILLSTS